MKRNVKEKILIAVVLLVLVVAIIVAVFMGRRGDGEVHSAYENTTVRTTTTTTVTKTNKAQEKDITIPTAFINVLNRYQNAFKYNYNSYSCQRYSVSTLLPELYEGTANKNVGYWVGDYNGDDTLDLIIGVMDGYDHYPYAILDYYTLSSSNQAVNVFRSTPTDYYSAVSGKRVMEKNTTTNGLTLWNLYGFNTNGQSLSFKEAVLRDKNANEKNPWYRSTDQDSSRDNDKKVSNTAGKKRQTQIDNARIQLEYTAFNKYDSSKTTT